MASRSRSGSQEGSTENATVATTLLALLVERGPGTTQGVLCVLDGSKALRKAVRDVLGDGAPVERSHPPQGAQHPRSPA